MEPKDEFEIGKILRLLKISMGTPHMEQLDVLREQNKDLLKQLKQKKEAFECQGDCTDGRVEKPKFQVETGEDCCSLQAASAEPSVLSAGDCSCCLTWKDISITVWSIILYVCVRVLAHAGTSLSDKVFEHKVSPPSLTAEQRQESAKCSMLSDFTTKGRRRSIHDNSTRHHFPPLLGYDWIAGIFFLLSISDYSIQITA